MRRQIINSKFLLTLVQRSLAIIIVIILFIFSSTLYFYHQIDQNWHTQFREKANFTIEQLENRFSNYMNCIYIFQNNQKVQYLCAQTEKTFSYRQSTYILEISELINAVSSPITEISNIYLYFPFIDLMVDYAGSSNLDVFQKYGNSSPYTYTDTERSAYYDGLEKVAEAMKAGASSEPGLEIQSVGQNHYLIFPGSRCSFAIVLNDAEFTRQLQGELFTEEALLEIYDGAGNLFAKNYAGAKPEQSRRVLSFSLDGRSYGLSYFFDFNMLSYYELMAKTILAGALACLAVVSIVVGIMWSLKRRLYNPLNDLIKKYRLEVPQGTVHEYSLVENTFHKYDAISQELETMRSELDQEMEGYAINQLVYEYGGIDQDFSPKMSSYCVAVADFETNTGEKDVEGSRAFYERLSGQFRVVKILSSTFSDVYMVPVDTEGQLRQAVSAALKDAGSPVSICGVSDCLTGIRQLKAAYRQAQRALWENPGTQRSLTCYGDIREKKPSATPLYSEQETKFLNSVLSHNYKEMEEQYEQLVQLYQNSSLERRHKLLLHLYDILCIILTNEQINPDEFFNEVSGQFSESILSSCNTDYLTRQLRICYQKYVLSHTEDKDTLLKMMTDFIDQNINRNISLQELADEMHLSYSYMGRYFRSRMDMGFVEYVQLRKITLAQELLLNSQMNLSEIAEKTGFTTVNSFFRTFKKVAGITPTQYRNQNH